jgi:hypothetical protein
MADRVRHDNPSGGTRPGAPVHAKIRPFRMNRMDAERINQIGNQLADLAARTAALRGYL